MALRRYETLYGDAAQYDGLNNNMTYFANLHNDTLDADEVREGLLTAVTEAPVVIALILPTADDTIQFVHSPKLCTRPGGIQDRVAVALGNVEGTILPLLLRADAFADCQPTGVHTNTADCWAALQAAGGAASPPLTVGDPGVTELRVSKAISLPGPWAARAVAMISCTSTEFYTTFLQPVVDGGDVAAVTAIQQWINWWKVGATRRTPGADYQALTQTAEVLTPANQLLVQSFVTRRIVETDLLRVAAPPAAGFLTNAGMTNAIQGLRDDLQAQETARVDYRTARNNLSFTDRYGVDISAAVHRLMIVADDVNLPEVHQALARNKESSRDYTLVDAALLQARAVTPLPVTDGNAPILTKHLLDNVFRRHNIHSLGTEFGEGLTPFAIVCKGHPGEKEARQRLEDSNSVERGGSTNLEDARAMSVSDARLPTELRHVVEKLYGFSLILDAYFGRTHILAQAVRNTAVRLGPIIQGLTGYCDSPGSALVMGDRVLFAIQQYVFRWLRKRRDTADGTAVPAPDFDALVADVEAYLLEGIPQLPGSWKRLIRESNDTPYEREGLTPRIRGGGGDGPAGGSSATARNPNVSMTLKNRWTASGHRTMSEMTANYTGSGSWSDAVPKFADGAPACLKYHLTGYCSENCRRKSGHKQAGPRMIQDLGGFMGQCGVAGG